VFAHPLGLKPLLASAARLYRAALGPATLVCCAFALPYAAADTAARRLGLSFLDAAQLRGGVQLLLGMAGSVALARLYLQASAARPPGPASLRDALAVAARRWPAGLAIGLVSGLAVGAGSALLVVPGVVVALNLSMALPLLAATGLDSNQVLRRSAALVLGKRRRLLPALAVAWLASVALAALLEQGENRLLEAMLMTHPVAGFLLDAVYEAMAGLCEAGLTAVLVAAYLQLAPPNRLHDRAPASRSESQEREA